MTNLYKYHSNPESILWYKEAFEVVPELVWEKYKNDPEELKKREHILAKDALPASYYAITIIRKPFPLGEEAISKNAHYSYWYAYKVLNKPFPLGEEAISKNEYWNNQYQQFLKPPFP